METAEKENLDDVNECLEKILKCLKSFGITGKTVAER